MKIPISPELHRHLLQEHKRASEDYLAALDAMHPDVQEALQPFREEVERLQAERDAEEPQDHPG